MGILRCINLNISWKFGSIEIRKCQRRLTLTDEQNSSQEDSCIKIDLISRPIKEGEKSSSIGINSTFMRGENAFLDGIWDSLLHLMPKQNIWMSHGQILNKTINTFCYIV